jgi:hypothetical protein
MTAACRISRHVQIERFTNISNNNSVIDLLSGPVCCIFMLFSSNSRKNVQIVKVHYSRYSVDDVCCCRVY